MLWGLRPIFLGDKGFFWVVESVALTPRTNVIVVGFQTTHPNTWGNITGMSWTEKRGAGEGKSLVVFSLCHVFSFFFIKMYLNSSQQGSGAMNTASRSFCCPAYSVSLQLTNPCRSKIFAIKTELRGTYLFICFVFLPLCIPSWL